MTENQKDPVGMILLILLFILTGTIGFIYYRSIDWTVLKRLEDTPLVLPTPSVSNNISIPPITATPSK